MLATQMGLGGITQPLAGFFTHYDSSMGCIDRTSTRNAVIVNYPPPYVGGYVRSIHLQRLLDQLLKMRKDGGVRDDVGCTGGAGSGLQRFFGLIREGDDGDVRGGFGGA